MPHGVTQLYEVPLHPYKNFTIQKHEQHLMTQLSARQNFFKFLLPKPSQSYLFQIAAQVVIKNLFNLSR